MSFPAWSKCFPSCGFLIWKSRLASPEPQFREQRQLDATVAALVAATIPPLTGLRIMVHGNTSRPDSSDAVGPIPARGASANRTHRSGPEANATQTRLQWRDADLTTPGGPRTPCQPSLPWAGRSEGAKFHRHCLRNLTVLDTDRVCPSARPHPVDELLARGALQQCVSHLVDIFGAGKLGEQVGQLPGRLLAKLPFDLPTKNQGLTLLAPLLGSL